MLNGAGETFLARDHAAWIQLLWVSPSGFIAGFLGSDRATHGFKYGFVSGVLTLAIRITGAFLGQIWYFLSLLGGIIAGGGMEILYALGLALLISGVALVLATFIVTVLSLAFGLFEAVGAGLNRTLPAWAP